MEFLELALLLLGGVLVSSLLEPLLPRVSLPLVQIALGIVIALFIKLPAEIELNTELFLVLFIAPLLFDESRSVDNASLWKNKGSILSLAIGLVVVSVFVVGFALHLLAPSIPLLAAFTVGAALGPTDAVAVASLGKDVALKPRQKAQLSGEALLNDASGVVSFQFAVAAAATGTFSLAEAGGTFAIDFLGGVALGLVLGAAYLFSTRKIRSVGLDNVTIHVLFEICLPFLIYLLAEEVGVSGIIAVVAAGLLVTFTPHRAAPYKTLRQSPESTRLSLVSDSVWDVLTFVLNGLIFLIMGILLPDLTEPILDGLDVTSLRTVWLVGVVLGVTLAMHALRYVWVLVMDFLSKNEETGGRAQLNRELFRNALVTTLSGAKGAVAIAIAFTIPTAAAGGQAFALRNTMIFVVCGVCVVTLLLANFVVPLLAPSDADDATGASADVEVEMLTKVIEDLQDRRTPENALAVSAVVRSYQQRIAVIKRKQVAARQLRALRLETLEKQELFIRDAMQEDSVDRRLAEQYLRRIDRLERQLKRASKDKLQSTQTIQPLASSTSTFRRVANDLASDRHVRSTLEFKIDVESVAVRHLEGASRSKDKERAEAAKALLAEHRPLLSALKQRKSALDEAEGIVVATYDEASRTIVKRTKDGKLKKIRPSRKSATLVADVQAEALRLELEQIQMMRRKGKISNAAAREMRQDVYLIQMGLNE